MKIAKLPRPVYKVQHKDLFGLFNLEPVQDDLYFIGTSGGIADNDNIWSLSSFGVLSLLAVILALIILVTWVLSAQIKAFFSKSVFVRSII